MTRRVVLDTSVLFPSSLRDLLLTLAAVDALEVRWSEEILREVTRAVTSRYPDIAPDKFEATTIAAMRAAFPEAVVDGWERAVGEMDNDEGDRHVAAAAAVAGVEAVVTFNVRHFEGSVLPARGIAVVEPGALVVALIEELPDSVVHAVVEMAKRKRHPPMTPDEILDSLSRHPGFDAVVMRLRDLIS